MVDDEPAIRQLYRMYFNVQGFEMTTVPNAIDALQEVYSKHFDAVMLDIGLVGANGLDLIEPIKAAQPSAAVFVFTGRPVDDKTRKEAFQRGAFQFFTKSHPLDYVVSELKRGIHLARIADEKHSTA